MFGDKNNQINTCKFFGFNFQFFNCIWWTLFQKLICFFLFDNECCFKLYCIVYAGDTELMVEPEAYIQKIPKLCQIILKISVGYPIHLMFLNYKGGWGLGRPISITWDGLSLFLYVKCWFMVFNATFNNISVISWRLFYWLHR